MHWMPWLGLRALIVAATMALAAPAVAGRSPPPVVAAASDLQHAIAALADAFERDTGQRVRVSLGSTGNFARQIRAGAPFELFMAADEAFVDALYRDGLVADPGRLYAVGRLVLLASPDGRFDPDTGLAGLAEAVAGGRVHRVAIANPEHAPYGQRAEAALAAAGVLETVRPRLVLGENVTQAAQFVFSGNAQAGLVALALVKGPDVQARGPWVLLPETMHPPLRQRMVLLPGASDTARAFHDFIAGPQGRRILAGFGFEAPGD